MRLRWRQAKLAWIAISPKSDDLRGTKLEKPVHKSIKNLCSHLLEIGGESVAVQFNEPPEICEAILKLGEIIPSNNIKVIKGDERECHTNSAVLWSKNRKKYFIVTGFALSNDGTWRRHSWIKTIDSKVIETTIKREKYFGIILTDEGAEAFLEDFHQ
jgi:hypothetical protein